MNTRFNGCGAAVQFKCSCCGTNADLCDCEEDMPISITADAMAWLMEGLASDAEISVEVEAA